MTICGILLASYACQSSLSNTPVTGNFSVKEEQGISNFEYQGQPFIQSRTYTFAKKEHFSNPNTKTNKKVLKDGRVVYNRWNTQKNGSFREEASVSPDGTEIEISFQTFFPSYGEEIMNDITTSYELTIPAAMFEGGSFYAIRGRGSSCKPFEGKLSGADWRSLNSDNYRFISLTDKNGDSISFDFNTQGPADMISDYSENSLYGMWEVSKGDDEIRMSAHMNPSYWGCPQTLKVRVFNGDHTSYDTRHALHTYSWGERYPVDYLFCFGAKKHGEKYVDVAKQLFDGKCGWDSIDNLNIQEEASEGAFYTSVTGKDKIFKVAGLKDAIYMLTIGTGNLEQPDVKYNIAINGTAYDKEVLVEKGKATTISMPVWTKDGCIDIAFNGDFRVSTLGLQCLLARAEDINFEREFWFTEGFEPSPYYHKGDYATRPKFASKYQTFTLPIPGQECAEPRKRAHLPFNALKTDENPGADWRFNAVISTFGPNNAGVFTEYSEDDALERRINDLKNNNINTILCNGMLSRHTYKAHVPRVNKALARFAKAAHNSGMKLIDHQDATLLWNIDAGFRVCCEKFDQIQIQSENQLPSPYFCFNNPEYKKWFFSDMKQSILTSKADAMMLDEVMMMEGCCTCSICREKFHEDTGWYLPVNECDDTLTKKDNILWKAWCQWRMDQVGNFFTELREDINTYRPDFSLMGYTTHYGMISRYSTIGYGLDIFQIGRGADYLGTEITTRNVIRGARAVHALRNAKSMMRIAYGVPVWGLIGSGGHSYAVDYFGWAINNMHGQTTWVNDADAKRPDYLPNFQLFKRNMDLKKATPVAEVALLFSSNSRDFGSGLGFSSELFGIAQTLGSMHVPYDIIGEMNFTPEILSKYKVLMLGCSSAISNETGDAIKEFAANGGTVYMTTTAGWENELGVRTEWRFADVFKHDIRRSFSRPKRFIDPATDQPVTLDFEPYCSLPAYTEEGQCPTTSMLWGIDDQDQRYPLMLEKKYGKGTFYYQPTSLALHLNAPEGYVGNKFDFQINPWLDNMYRNLLAQIIGNANYWKTDAPDLVLTTIYKQDNEYIVHFLNATAGPPAYNEPVTFGLPYPEFPPIEKDIAFTFPCADPVRVYAVSPDYDDEIDLVFTKNPDGTFSAILPKQFMQVYTLVKIVTK